MQPQRTSHLQPVQTSHEQHDDGQLKCEQSHANGPKRPKLLRRNQKSRTSLSSHEQRLGRSLYFLFNTANEHKQQMMQMNNMMNDQYRNAMAHQQHMMMMQQQ